MATEVRVVADQQKIRVQRAAVFIGLVVVVFGLLISRLWYLQIVKGDNYSALADGNRIRRIPIAAPRGLIVGTDGTIVAGNRFAFTVSAVPGGLGPNPEPLVQRLAGLLMMDEQTIEHILSTSQATYPYEPIRLLRDVGTEAVMAIEEHRMDLPGVLVEEEWMRDYHFGTVGGNVIGYLGATTPAQVRQGYRSTDLVGQQGLEAYYEEWLRGTDGYIHVEVNSLSRPIRVIEGVDPVPGHTIYVTLDMDLQRTAEQALTEHLTSLRTEFAGAHAGAVVVLDAKTGAVLTLASIPTYDPNRLIGASRGEYFAQLNAMPGKPFLHRAVRAYPAGSVFKVVTGVAALDHGALQIDETYNATGTHLYGRQDWTVRSNLPPAGVVDITMALARSVNDFFWEMATRPAMGGPAGGINVLATYAREFGFGQPTGIDFSPDMAGLVPDPQWKQQYRNEPWYPGETLNVAIGQGDVSVTPLQLAVAYSAIANRGRVYTPYLVQRIETVAGRPVYTHPGSSREMQVSPQFWEPIIEGLRLAIQYPRGTAYNALFAPDDRPWGAAATYDPAGKTGSAQRAPDTDAHAWFAGFAPAHDPEIVVAVYVEEGGGGGRGAAPIARRIMDHYFQRRQISSQTP